MGQARLQQSCYGRPIKGTIASITNIERQDLQDYVKRVFARDQLVISVVGDIDAERWATCWTRSSAISGHAVLTPIADAPPRSGPPAKSLRWTLRNPWPSSAIAASAPRRRFHRRLCPELRWRVLLAPDGRSSEKRGLAYSVYSNLYPYQHGAVFVATKTEAVGQSLAVIKSELKRLSERLPERIEVAKSYLMMRSASILTASAASCSGYRKLKSSALIT